jgi:hypothetical protein
MDPRGAVQQSGESNRGEGLIRQLLFGETDLEHEHAEHDSDEHHQQDDASHREGRLLIVFSLFQLDDALSRVLDDLLHVVVDPIQDRALVNHEHRKLFKNLSKFFDRFRDPCDLLVSLVHQLERDQTNDEEAGGEGRGGKERARTSSVSSKICIWACVKPLSISPIVEGFLSKKSKA